MSKEFKFNVKIRYSDKNDGGIIHPSTYLNFFESARFKVMDEFIKYCSERKYNANYMLEEFFYVVASMNMDMLESYKGDEYIDIVTTLNISKIPLLVFNQRAQNKDGKVFASATIKNALVSSRNFSTVTKWNTDTYNFLTQFTN